MDVAIIDQRLEREGHIVALALHTIPSALIRAFNLHSHCLIIVVENLLNPRLVVLTGELISTTRHRNDIDAVNLG